jgi:putative transposase
MNRPERLALVDRADRADRADPAVPIATQCQLLKVARSTLYYCRAPASVEDLAVMRRMDELYLASPFYGSRRMTAVLRREGVTINRKRVRRLMRLMGLEAIYQKPDTSRGQPEHRICPYLLRGLAIDRPNQVWCADITYIPMAKGFVYLVAVGAADAFRHIDPLRGPMDWFTRRVLAWRVSIGMEADFCVEAVREAMDRHGPPAIFNTDQGAQFTSAFRHVRVPRTKRRTSAEFVGELQGRGVRVSMDGRGRYLDNIFIERLWRSLKYEEVFIKAYGAVIEARRGIGGWLEFYNDERPHQALAYRTPREVFEGRVHEQEREVLMY